MLQIFQRRGPASDPKQPARHHVTADEAVDACSSKTSAISRYGTFVQQGKWADMFGGCVPMRGRDAGSCALLGTPWWGALWAVLPTVSPTFGPAAVATCKSTKISCAMCDPSIQRALLRDLVESELQGCVWLWQQVQFIIRGTLYHIIMELYGWSRNGMQ